jgi:cell wall assembly regulator SMI1
MNAPDLELDWRTVEEVLQRAAPELVRQLAGPAQEVQIQEFEDAIGLRLPAVVKHAYLRHDGCRASKPGQRLFVPFYRWCSLNEAAETWQRYYVDYLEYKADEYMCPQEEESWRDLAVCPGAWRPEWIPIGLSNTSAILCIDMAPCPQGTIGQLIQYSGETGGRLIARSFGHYMHALLGAIDDQRVIYSADEGEWVDAKSGEFIHERNLGPVLHLP